MAIQRRSFLTRLGLGLGAIVTSSFESAGNTIRKKMEDSHKLLNIHTIFSRWVNIRKSRSI